MSKNLSTDPYKGTRDFYPSDMAIQRYIFEMWAKTAESFGYERYDASILEPSELYKSKGAENEEMVNEQTYTFIDRGDREVTLRPEMTPTVARMVAAKHRDLSFPVRWYSIPNLFRYERPQRGRLREHWQLNCDMFGVSDVSADIEVIQLAYNVLTGFGASPEMFEIRVNNRQLMTDYFLSRYHITEPDTIRQITRILDQKQKIADAEFKGKLQPIFQEQYEQFRSELDLDVESFVNLINTERNHSGLIRIKNGLANLGISNVTFDASLARGFDYYTGTIFEIFDTSPDNNRALIGGGRYDNLTGLFGGESVTGIGFGMGDVTMRDFLETHNLLPSTISVTAPTLVIVPTDEAKNVPALVLADTFRKAGISTAVDSSDKKLGKKIGSASDAGVRYVIVLGDNEIESQTYTLKYLVSEEEKQGTITELINSITR